MLHRRGLILGLTSLIVSPNIVRASSLMQLRGVNMDPLVLAFESDFDGLTVSSLHGPFRSPATYERILQFAQEQPDFYKIVRKSETVGNNW